MGYGYISQSVPAVDAAMGDQATSAVLAEAGEAHFLGVRVDGKTAYSI